MTRKEKEFWVEYSRLCNQAMTHESEFVRTTRKGFVAQMDVQAFFDDYNIRKLGVDCITSNQLKLEVKTGTRFAVNYGKTDDHMYSDFVVYNPSPTLGSCKHYRVYNAEQFFDTVKPFTQETNQGSQRVRKVRDNCKKHLLMALDDIFYWDIEDFKKEVVR